MRNRVIKCVFSVICLVCLVLCLNFQCACLDYSVNAPSYVREQSNFYIQVNTSELGACTFLFPVDYEDNILATYQSSQVLYNTSMSMVNGYVCTSNGTYYRLRFSALNTAEYYTSTSYGQWVSLTVTNLVTTNGSVGGSNGLKKVILDDYQILIISSVIMGIISFLILYVIKVFGRLARSQ